MEIDVRTSFWVSRAEFELTAVTCGVGHLTSGWTGLELSAPIFARHEILPGSSRRVTGLYGSRWQLLEVMRVCRPYNNLVRLLVQMTAVRAVAVFS